MSTGRSILRSTVVLSAGQLINLGLTLATTVVIARTVGEETFGYFYWLLALLNLLALLPDFGLSPIVLREIARDQKGTGSLLGTSLLVRTCLVIVSAVLFTIAAPLAGLEGSAIVLVNFLLLNVLFSSKLPIHRYSLEGVFRAQLRMKVPMVLSTLDGVVLLAGALLLLHPGSPVSTVVMLYTLSNVPGFAILLFLVLRSEGIRLSFSMPVARDLLRWAFPIAVYVALVALTMNVDVLLLRLYRGDAAVGIYAAATRFALPLMFLPASVVSSLFPSLAVYAERERDKMKDAFVIGLKVLLVLGVAIAVFGTVAGDTIVSLFYGDRFREAGLPLKILLWNMMVVFVSFLLTNFNIAVDRQRVNASYAALICGANVALNLVLIPAFSAVGAASARLVAEVAGCGFLAFGIRRHVTISLTPLMGRLILLACGFGLVLVLLEGFGLVLLVLGGGTAFVGLVAAMRVFDRVETQKFRMALQWRR